MECTVFQECERPKGTLISIEGIDGAGKSTQSFWMASRMDMSGFNRPAVFSDPPKTMIGNFVRENITQVRMSPMCQLMLVSAARADNFRRYIKPLLDLDRIVLVDRFVHSSMVYQHEHKDDALLLHTIGCGRYPDKVFILDLPADEAMKRIPNPDVMENVALETLELRRELFRELSNLPEIELIEVSGLTEKQVSDILFDRIMDFLRDRGVVSEK